MLLYNNELMRADALRLPLTNRAFQYNDGFFETIMIRHGELCFWEAHQQRMQEAAHALQLNLPAYFFLAQFPVKLLKLAQAQQAQQLGRIKLKVWRAGAGLYTPETNTADWLATAQPVSPATENPLRVGVCQHVQAHYTPLSHFKGPNAPLYVMAGLEKKSIGLDDLLLLDRRGAIAEFISANVFWIKNGALYTPALETGCVNGVLRRSIFRWCELHEVTVMEEVAEVNNLYEADAVFAANVTGIKTVGSLEGKEISTNHPLLQRLKEELFD